MSYNIPKWLIGTHPITIIKHSNFLVAVCDGYATPAFVVEYKDILPSEQEMEEYEEKATSLVRGYVNSVSLSCKRS